jgi:hypothetical protein
LLNRHQLFGFCRELRQHLHCPRMSVKKEFWLKKTDGDNVRLPLQSSSAVECSEVGAREISQQLKKQLNKIQAKKGPTGFEPVTSWSAVKCSTTELWTPCCRYCLTRSHIQEMNFQLILLLLSNTTRVPISLNLMETRVLPEYGTDRQYGLCRAPFPTNMSIQR